MSRPAHCRYIIDRVYIQLARLHNFIKLLRIRCADGVGHLLAHFPKEVSFVQLIVRNYKRAQIFLLGLSVSTQKRENPLAL